jgi:hypothetical protein
MMLGVASLVAAEARPDAIERRDAALVLGGVVQQGGGRRILVAAMHFISRRARQIRDKLPTRSRTAASTR